MERAGSQGKRPNVWQIPAYPRYESTNTPSKSGLEKRRLSLRSENRTITEATATTTPQSSSLSSRQATGSTQKQPGKENESPFLLLDDTGKIRATIGTNSTTKRKKSSNSTSYITNSEKKIIRRRLSGDYEEQLLSNKFYRANPIVPIAFSSRAVQPATAADLENRHDFATRFSVHDDGNNSAGNSIGFPRAREITATGKDFKTEMEKFERGEGREVNEAKTETSGADDTCRENLKYGQSNIPRGLYFLWDSYRMYKTREVNRAASIYESNERKVNNEDESSATRQRGDRDGPEFSDSRAARDREMSGAEFRIERIDCNGGGAPVANNFRKVKSGSDIGRLNVPLRRGDDISPLKRRMNQLLKKSAIIAGRSRGLDGKGATAYAVTGMVTAVGCHVSNGKIGLKCMEEVRKLGRATVPSSDQTKQRKCGIYESTTDPATEATKKRARCTGPEAGRATEEAEMEEGGDQIARQSMIVSRPVERKKSTGDMPSLAGCSRTEVGAAQLDIGLASDGDPRVDRKIDTEPRVQDINVCDRLRAAVPKFENNFEPPLTNGIEPIRFTSCKPVQAASERQPAGGSGKITRGGGMIEDRRAQWAVRNRTTANATAAATPSLCPGGANNRFPITDANKVRPDQESRTIKFAGKISGLFHDVPLEIQYTTDYTEDTIDLEHAREGYCYKMSGTFLKGGTVTPEQRRIVVNFLISVHAYLLAGSSTLHQATRMFDAILDIKDVSVKELQLVALGALWIAMKNMETRVPTASEMISFAKDMYHAEGPGLLCKCERKILKTLGFNIRFPDPFYMSAYHLQQWSSLETVANEPSILRTIYRCASYLMDVALLGLNYSGTPGELMAVAATQTAARLVLNTSWEYPVDPLPRNNEKLTGYTQEEIDRVAGPLLEGVLESAKKDSPVGAVYKKYRNIRYDNTSDYLVMKINKLPSLTRGNKN